MCFLLFPGPGLSQLEGIQPDLNIHKQVENPVFVFNNALVTPARRGKSKQAKTAKETQRQTPAEQRASMTRAQRLKRVFNIDIETCIECGDAVKIIASIEEPAVINKILTHLDKKAATAGTARSVETALLPPCRAPPATGLFD